MQTIALGITCFMLFLTQALAVPVPHSSEFDGHANATTRSKRKWKVNKCSQLKLDREDFANFGGIEEICF